jgi:hypothetical protein
MWIPDLKTFGNDAETFRGSRGKPFGGMTTETVLKLTAAAFTFRQLSKRRFHPQSIKARCWIPDKSVRE